VVLGSPQFLLYYKPIRKSTVVLREILRMGTPGHNWFLLTFKIPYPSTTVTNPLLSNDSFI